MHTLVILRARRCQKSSKRAQSWPRKSAQGDKWSFCLTVGTLCLRIRSDHEETTPPEPHTGLQGKGGSCRRQRRSNNSSAGGAVRRASEPDHVVEGAALGRGWRGVSSWGVRRS